MAEGRIATTDAPPRHDAATDGMPTAAPPRDSAAGSQAPRDKQPRDEAPRDEAPSDEAPRDEAPRGKAVGDGAAGDAAIVRYALRRPDCDADWAAYHGIRQDVSLEAREFARHPPEDDEELAPLHHPLLLWCDGQPIGTIRVDRLEGDRAAFRLVAIDPPAQGRGHGRGLLHHAERFAREIGCRTVVVYATPEAAGFYAQAGYVEDVWDESCLGGIVQMMKPLS